jgi:hypothetical protein
VIRRTFPFLVTVKPPHSTRILEAMRRLVADDAAFVVHSRHRTLDAEGLRCVAALRNQYKVTWRADDACQLVLVTLREGSFLLDPVPGRSILHNCSSHAIQHIQIRISFPPWHCYKS